RTPQPGAPRQLPRHHRRRRSRRRRLRREPPPRCRHRAAPAAPLGPHPPHRPVAAAGPRGPPHPGGVLLLMRAWMQLALLAAVEATALAFFGRPFLFDRGEPKREHLPGKTSDGHYQIELACDTCHTPFRGVENAACLRCHTALGEVANDSHPERLFS